MKAANHGRAVMHLAHNLPLTSLSELRYDSHRAAGRDDGIGAGGPHAVVDENLE